MMEVDRLTTKVERIGLSANPVQDYNAGGGRSQTLHVYGYAPSRALAQLIEAGEECGAELVFTQDANRNNVLLYTEA